MHGRFHDGINYLSKLTPRKLGNGLKVWISFHWNKITGSTVHPAWPVSISVEPTTACNLGCPECPSGLKIFSRPTGNLKEPNFKKWIYELSAHLTYINFYFQGEPFINPTFLSMVKYASSRKIYTSTSTNAHFLTPEIAEKTIESGLDRLIISIDGTTQEVYSGYRVNGELEKVIEGTKNIIEAKRKKKSRTPHVIFQFLVVRHNEHQVEEVKKLGKELGVDEVRFKTAQVYDYTNGNPLIPTQDKFSRYRKNADGTYSVKNVLDDHCWRMWSSCVITWNGFVVPCCFDKDAVHRMGDLSSSKFTDVWNDSLYRRFREQLFSSRKEIDICSNCSEGTRVWA
jgi:radical SAM protein with 4Fe4S-binding SPASM domain